MKKKKKMGIEPYTPPEKKNEVHKDPSEQMGVTIAAFVLNDDHQAATSQYNANDVDSSEMRSQMLKFVNDDDDSAIPD